VQSSVIYIRIMLLSHTREKPKRTMLVSLLRSYS